MVNGYLHSCKNLKKIEAIIRTEKLMDVREALVAADVLGITASDVVGKGHQKDIQLQFRGQEIKIDLHPKTKVEILISNSKVNKVVEILEKSASTGNVGDGKIIVLPVDDIIRIRTGEHGKDAI